MANKKGERGKPWLNPPLNFTGSLPEWAIFWGHTSLGLRDGVEFTYQRPFAGGRSFTGGAVIDFFENDLNIAVRIQGRYFHIYAGGDQRSSDLIQKLSIESQGIIVVDIDEEVALDSPLEAVREARKGREISAIY